MNEIEKNKISAINNSPKQVHSFFNVFKLKRVTIQKCLALRCPHLVTLMIMHILLLIKSFYNDTRGNSCARFGYVNEIYRPANIVTTQCCHCKAARYHSVNLQPAGGSQKLYILAYRSICCAEARTKSRFPTNLPKSSLLILKASAHIDSLWQKLKISVHILQEMLFLSPLCLASSRPICGRRHRFRFSHCFVSARAIDGEKLSVFTVCRRHLHLCLLALGEKGKAFHFKSFPPSSRQRRYIHLTPTILTSLSVCYPEACNCPKPAFRTTNPNSCIPWSLPYRRWPFSSNSPALLASAPPWTSTTGPTTGNLCAPLFRALFHSLDSI